MTQMANSAGCNVYDRDSLERSAQAVNVEESLVQLALLLSAEGNSAVTNEAALRF